MPSKKSTLEFGVKFTTDQASVNAVKKSLQDIQNIKFKDFNGPNKQLRKIIDTAAAVEQALTKAFNVNLGTLNTKQFNQELKQTVGSVDKVYTQFSKLGAQGKVAFSQMASSVLTTNLQLKQTNSLISSMGQTMANTVKWGIASSVMNSFTNSVRSAFDYVKGLDAALTDIRIVTGDSTEQMRLFAEQANRTAQTLGRSTMDYTKAALTFYQQGLDEQSVQARTQSVLTAQNITGAGDQMADYLTAVWNGYKVANEEAELYVDKLAAVADSSASNMSQLAIAMSKVASTANMLGVPVDSLNAQIATIVATTRQAPETVGNALKTIYARINDITTGADDAEISLGNYTKQMAALGVSVLDSNGKLRDTGDVIEQIGGKWETLSREQQIYLARTMAGQRQYNNLLALFENWSKYSDLVTVSMDAQGAAAEKNSRYMESLSAKLEQFGAAGERVKTSLIDEESLKKIVEFGTNAVNVFGSLIQSIGGGSGALLNFGSIFASLFSNTIAKQINNVVTNIKNAQNNADILKADLEETERFGASQGYTMKDSTGKGAIEQMVQAKKAAQQYYDYMDQAQINNYNNIVKEIGAAKDQVLILTEQKEKAEEFLNVFSKANSLQGLPFQDITIQASNALESIEEIKSSLSDFKIDEFENIEGQISSLVYNFADLKKAVGGDQVLKTLPGWKAFQDALKAIQTEENHTADQAEALKKALENLLNQSAGKFNDSLNLDQTNQNLDQAKAKLDLAQQAAQNYLNAIKQFATVKTFVNMTTGLAQVASGINNIVNLTKIWKNQNLSTGEKLLQTFTNLTMTVTQFTTALSKLNKVRKSFSEMIVKGVLALKAQAAAYQQDAAGATQAGIAETGKVVTDQLSGDAALVNAGKQVTLGEALSFVALKAKEALIAFGPWIAIGAAVAVSIYAIYKAWNKEAQAAKRATDVANDAKDKYKQLKEAYDELKQAFSDYKNAQNAIDELITGTQQWRDAIRQANDSVLELLENYPKLAQYVTSENGRLIISQQGQNTLLAQQQQQLNIARLSSQELSAESSRANLRVQAQSIGRESARLIGISNNPELIEKLAAQLKKASDVSGKNIEALAQEYNISTTVAQQLLQLASKIDALKTSIDLQTETIVSQQLQNKGYLDGIEGLDKQIVAAFSSSEYQKSVDKVYDTLTSFKFNRFTSASDPALQEMLRQYNEANDSNYRLASNAVTKDGVIHLIDNITGQVDEVFQEQMASAIASSKALEELGISADKAKEALLNIENALPDENKNGVEGQAVKKLIAGQDFSSFTESELNEIGSIPNDVLESIYTENKAILEKTFKTSTDFINAKTDALNKAEQAGLKELAASPFPIAFKNTLKNIFDQLSLDKNLTASAKENISLMLTKALATGGGDAVLGIKEFYEQISDISAFEQLSAGLDYSTLTVEQFRQQIEEVGLSTNASNKALQEFIKLQRLQYEPLSGQQSASTFSLLNKQASGESLSDEEASALNESLIRLQANYTHLQQSVKIINSTWLEGTYQYKKALEDINAQLMTNAEQDLISAKANQDSAEYYSLLKSISAELQTFILNSEQLQNARNKELLTEQDFITVLERLSAQYESCSDQLDKYYIARQQGNQAEQEAAQFELQLALRSAENAQAYDKQAERISQVAKHFVQLAEAGQKGYEGLQKNAELAADAATRYIRLNDAIEDLYSNLEEYTEILELARSSEEGFTEAISTDEFKNLKDSIADLLDTQSELLSNRFIVDHMQEIVAAANGSQQAIDSLSQAASKEILINMGVDTSVLGKSYDEIAQWAAELPEGQLKVEDTEFLQQLVDAWVAAGHGRDKIEQALSGMHLDVDLVDPLVDQLNTASQVAAEGAANVSDSIVDNMGVDVQPTTENKQFNDQQQVAGYTAEAVPMTAPVSVPRVQITTTPVGPLPFFSGYSTEDISFSGIRVSPDTPKKGTASKKTVSATGLKVKNARKTSGGKVNWSNKNKGSQNNKTGSGGGGGKGSSKKPTVVKPPKAPEAKETIEQRSDPYHDINLALEKQENKIKDIQDAEKHLTDYQRLENLQKQNDQLEAQNSLFEDKIAIAEGQLVRIGNELQDSGISIKFNSDGTIANYNEALDNALKNYNAAVDTRNTNVDKAYQDYLDYITKYNAMTAEQQQAHKDQLEKVKDNYEQIVKAEDKALSKQKEKYDAIKNNIKSYEDTIDIINDLKEKYKDNIEQIRDNIIELSKIKVDLSIDSGQLEREWLNFENKVIKKLDKDDFLGNAKANVKELMSYFDSEQVQQVNDQIARVRQAIATIQAGGSDDIYGTRLGDAEERLSELLKQQQDQLENIQDLVDKIKDNYLDALDDAKDKMDDQIDQYERINDLIDHNVKLTQLLYGDKAYDTMNKYYDMQKDNNEQVLQNLRMQQIYWQNQMNNEEVGSDAWKKMKEIVDDITDQLNSNLEDMIENLSDQWQNRVNQIIDKLNNALTGGRGLDYLDEQWDYINNFDDNFLDPVESRMGINEITSLYQQAIDGLTGSPRQQEKINKLMNDQLKLLREKDNLTQYDLDRAKASLEVEKARLALEEARDNKTKMRLRRDSQGNYTYQYIADEEKLSDLQQSLADAEANLYNMDKEHYKQNLNDMYDSYKDYTEKRLKLAEELRQAQVAGEEEAAERVKARMALLDEQYSKLMDAFAEDNQITYQVYLPESTFAGLGLNQDDYSFEEQMEIVNRTVPQAASNIQDLINKINGQGGFFNSMRPMIEQITQITDQYVEDANKILSTAGTSVDTIMNVTDATGNALDTNIQKATNLIGVYQDFANTAVNSFEQVREVVEDLNNTLDQMYDEQGFVEQAKKAYNLLQELKGAPEATYAENLNVADRNLDTTETGSGIPSTDAQTLNYFANTIASNLDESLNNIDISNIDQQTFTNIMSSVLGAIQNMNSVANQQMASLTGAADGYIGTIGNVEHLDQNVHIEANFPNVQGAREIEEAFNNLVNMASMYASKYRD